MRQYFKSDKKKIEASKRKKREEKMKKRLNKSEGNSLQNQIGSAPSPEVGSQV